MDFIIPIRGIATNVMLMINIQNPVVLGSNDSPKPANINI